MKWDTSCLLFSNASINVMFWLWIMLFLSFFVANVLVFLINDSRFVFVNPYGCYHSKLIFWCYTLVLLSENLFSFCKQLRVKYTIEIVILIITKLFIIIIFISTLKHLWNTWHSTLIPLHNLSKYPVIYYPYFICETASSIV